MSLSRTPHDFSPNELQSLSKEQWLHRKVYRTTWRGQPVAVKQMIVWGPLDLYRQKSYETERKALIEAQVNHAPNILGYVGCGSYMVGKATYHCIVTPYMAQGNLGNYIKNHSVIAWSARLNMMMCLVNAVAYLHGRNVLHRDIKSLNIYVNDNEKEVVLADLDSACDASTDTFNGTDRWMAPEIIGVENAKNTYATDVYALTVVFNELAAWVCALYADLDLLDDDDSEDNNVSAEAERFAQPIADTAKPKMAKLITWGWAQKPEDRPTILEIKAALNQIELR